MYLIKTPWLLKKFYPKALIWNKPRNQKTIYLTFDDGPIPIVTPFVLKTLKKFNAKATFFCIGENIVKHTEIFDQLKADGHSVGNHTFNHLKGWATKDRVYLENIRKCQEITKSSLFRPPYGRIKKSQIKNLMALSYKTQDNLQSSPISNLQTQISKIIMWDVLSGDFDTSLAPEKCLENVIKHTENGSIVVFHDSLKARERLEFALPKALEKWQAEGYQFAALV
jgi:peptidoglycan/xylan/chitin deacetylase (PgdA/CDA1 family)